MLLRIKKLVYLSGYKIGITFSNGKTRVVDFENWIFDKKGNVYLEPLKDVEYFKKFDLDESNYTICWPNGADFCPDVLYDVGREAKKTKKRITSSSKKVKPRKKRKTYSST